jgi:Uncharacterized protein conserved in bacteria (DUF2314)
MKLIAIVVIAFLAFLIWLRYFHISRPVVLPLSIAPDDALTRNAMDNAKDTIPRFQELAAQPNRGIRVKVPFVSSSSTLEFLWAEVLAFHDSVMEVRYLTPPVTHTGRLKRLHTHPVSDLVDWLVELESGKYAGGYTMRVMFVRGREQWGSLPPKMEAEEKKYE